MTASLLTACHWVRTGDPAPLQPIAATQVKTVGTCTSTGTCRDSLDIVAMGVSGFLFVPWRDSTQLVMTPPSYTNPTLWWTVLGNWLFGSSPNVARIARRLRDLSAIGPDRLARVRAIAWEHAPNFGMHVIARGNVTRAKSALPRGLFGWKLGRVYAYAINVLDPDGSVGNRMIVHDAGAAPDVVRRAVQVIGNRPTARSTVLIITTANFDQAPSYPDILLASLAAQRVLLGHWADFFRSPEQSERVVRGIHARQLVEIVQRYQGDRWTALRAGATLRVRY